MKLSDRIRRINRQFRRIDSKTRRLYPFSTPYWSEYFQALRRLVGDRRAVAQAERAESLIDLF